MLELWPTAVAPLVEAGRPESILLVGPDPELHARALRAAEAAACTLAVIGADELPDASPDLAIVAAPLPAEAVRRLLDRLAESAGNGLPITVVALAAGRALAGVESFVSKRERPPVVIVLPGFGGVAIVVDPARVEGDGPLPRLLAELTPSPALRAHLIAIDAAHARDRERAAASEAELEAAHARLDRHGEVVASRDRLRARMQTLVEDRARSLGGRPAVSPATRPVDDAVDLEDHVRRRLAALRANSPELALPTPRDRRRLLVTDEHAPRVVVHACGPESAVRACLWSVVERADRPLRLSVVLPAEASPEVRELLAELVVRIPAIARVDLPPGAAPSVSLFGGGGPWLALFDRPAVVPHGWLARAEALIGDGPLAAPGTAELGVPPAIGAEAAALAGARDEVAVSSPVCRLVPAGADAGATPDRGPVALVLDDGPGEPEGARWHAERIEAELRDRLAGGPRVAYLLPGFPPGGSGGGISVLQEAVALAGAGVEATVAIPGEAADRAGALIPASRPLLRPFSEPRELGPALGDAEIVVATESSTVELVAGAVPDGSGRLRAYYVQDYEALFRAPDTPPADAAILSYRRASPGGLFAKTHWVANLVAGAHGLPVGKVDASLDRSVFYASGRREADALRVVAMVRPRTPRRRPAATLALLERLARELGAGVDCAAFGCTGAELERLAGRAPAGVRQLGILDREGVAEAMRAADVFVDLSVYQAFGRTGLEAMACGAVPVLPALGGAAEFAADGENAILAGGPEAAAAAIRELAAEPERLSAMRTAGIDRAAGFSPLRAAMSQYAFLTSALERIG